MLFNITAVNYKGPEKNKWGKDSWKVGIQTAETGDKWMNGFLPFAPDRWKGTQQELLVEDKEVGGVVYKNFKLPPREEKSPYAKPQAPVVDITLHQKLDKIIDHLSGVRPLNRTSDGGAMPDFAPDGEW